MILLHHCALLICKNPSRFRLSTSTEQPETPCLPAKVIQQISHSKLLLWRILRGSNKLKRFISLQKTSNRRPIHQDMLVHHPLLLNHPLDHFLHLPIRARFWQSRTKRLSGWGVKIEKSVSFYHCVQIKMEITAERAPRRRRRKK